MNKILYKVAKVYRATFLSWLHPVSLPQQAVQYWKNCKLWSPNFWVNKSISFQKFATNFAPKNIFFKFLSGFSYSAALNLRVSLKTGKHTSMNIITSRH